MKGAIKQKHSLGCGFACLAFVTGLSYDHIISYFGKIKAKKEGLYCREIVNFLKRFFPKAHFKYLKPKWKRKIYQDGTIVFIKRSEKYPYGHYLVRYKNLWMDPWINLLKDERITKAKAGFRKRLPGKPIYAIFLK